MGFLKVVKKGVTKVCKFGWDMIEREMDASVIYIPEYENLSENELVLQLKITYGDKYEGIESMRRRMAIYKVVQMRQIDMIEFSKKIKKLNEIDKKLKERMENDWVCFKEGYGELSD